MKKKLTLRLDKKLIDKAKKRASQKGTSVSKLVANYFSALEEEVNSSEKLSPITTSLMGILEDADIEEKDYKRHLKEKYLK